MNLYITKNLKLRNLDKKDFNSNFLNLLSQLTVLDINKIDKCNFDNMIDMLNDNHVILVLEDIKNNIIVSSITYFKEHKFIHNMGKVAHIEDVVVDKLYRGQGLGYKLINYVY